MRYGILSAHKMFDCFAHGMAQLIKNGQPTLPNPGRNIYATNAKLLQLHLHRACTNC